MTPASPVSHWVTGMYPGLYALFLLGVAASRFAVPQATPDPRRWERLLLGLLVAGLAVQVLRISRFDPSGPLNDLWLGPLFALVVTRLVRGGLAPVQSVLASRPLVWLGQASYSLYLIHAFVLEMVWRWLVTPLGAGVPASLLLELVLGATASVVVARGFYFLVERPFLVTKPIPTPVEEPVVIPQARKVPVHA
jgi:peptidoglycan/LPS O-acetylase OafA/YrhL